MFKFAFSENVTKEFILTKISEEEIFCYYLGIKEISKKLICSRLRTDNRPTCGFYRNGKGDLYLHDFATGEFYSCFSLVMAMFNVDFYSALKIIANDFNLKSYDNLPRTAGTVVKNVKRYEDSGMSKIQIQMQDFTPAEKEWWMQYGITEKTLKRFKVFSCRAVFLNDNLFSLIKYPDMAFGYYGGKMDGNELWRIYYPRNKEKGIRFLTNWPAKKLQGFEMLPKKGNLLVITKSMKDCMCLYEFGIPAIAPNSENLFVSDSVLEQLKARFKHIVVIYDNDAAGIANMWKIKKAHPELIYTWIPRKYGIKDISDFYKYKGRGETLNLITQFVKWLKNRWN
jgi:hypothetical protein